MPNGQIVWNRRFDVFCQAHGLSPATAAGSTNAKYIAWIGQQLDAWEKETGRTHPRSQMPLSQSEHLKFDAWLLRGSIAQAKEDADARDVLADRAAEVAEPRRAR